MGSTGEENGSVYGRHEQLLLLLAVDNVRLWMRQKRDENGRCRVADDFGGVETADVGVHLLDDVSDLLVGAEGRLLEMENEAVDLVDDEDGLHSLLEGLFQNGERLRAHALDHIHHNETAVAESHLFVTESEQRNGSRHVGAEIDVAGRVHEVDEVGNALLHLFARLLI